MNKKEVFVMEYRLARTYEEQGYTIATNSIEEENGKLYAEIVCDCYKCGGRGRIPYFGHVDQGVCFACGGFGRFSKHARVYIEEERNKMDAAAERRKEKKLEEAKAQAEGKIKAWKEKYNLIDLDYELEQIDNYLQMEENKSKHKSWFFYAKAWLNKNQKREYDNLPKGMDGKPIKNYHEW